MYVSTFSIFSVCGETILLCILFILPSMRTCDRLFNFSGHLRLD